MPEGSRRLPPGQSFAFLRKNDGMKSKINYPILRTRRTASKPMTFGRDEDQTEGNDYHCSHQPCDQERCQTTASLRDIAPTTDLAWQGVSARRTVQTADSGFDQAVNMNNEELSISSPDDYSSSPRSSCFGKSNVELRKEHALPVQQRVRNENSSFPETEVIVPSPMLASTPHPDEMIQSAENVAAVNRETSILGDTTNIMERSNAEMLRKDVPSKGIFPVQANECRNRRQSTENGCFVSRDVIKPPIIGSSGYMHPQVATQYDTRDSQQPHTPSAVPRVGVHEQTARGYGHKYTNVEEKLVGQLRDVIAHLDYADIKQQTRAKELEDAYQRFQRDVLDFEAEKEAEKERVLRTRRELERQKRNVTKDGTEREKALVEQIDELTKTIAEKDRQMSTQRLRLKKTGEQLEAKEKELNESYKKAERLEKTCKILQRQMAQLRGNYAKQSQELAAEIQAARSRNLRRKGSIGILPTLDKYVPIAPQEPSLLGEREAEQQKTVRERSKSVSWADTDTAGQGTSRQASPRKNPLEMKLIEEGAACFGPCRLFKNCLGEWTKVTTTTCGCDFFEYSNSDVRWFSCDRRVQVYYYGIVGATVIAVANGCTIRYFNDGQIEIYRLSGEISRFDSSSSQRYETMLDENSSRYVEIFDCAGYCLRLWGGGHSSERFNERSSFRGNLSNQYVYNHSNVEPEWVEPDFYARRCPDGSLKIKFFNVMICCLGLEDVGYVKHTTRLEDGQERKRMCVEWGHVAREKQRQFESRKCQRLTAFNATM